MARVCRLLALLAALASAKEKKVIGPTSNQLRCTPGPGTDEHKDCITSSQPVDLRCGKCRKTPYYIPFCTAYPGEFFHVLHDCILPEICLIEQLHQQNGSACYEDWQAHWVKFFAPHSQRAKTCGQTSSTVRAQRAVRVRSGKRWSDCCAPHLIQRLSNQTPLVSRAYY